jgi:hypothetical protein
LSAISLTKLSTILLKNRYHIFEPKSREARLHGFTGKPYMLTLFAQMACALFGQTEDIFVRRGELFVRKIDAENGGHRRKRTAWQ